MTRVQWIAEKNLEADCSMDYYDYYDSFCEYFDRISFETYKRYCREAFQNLSSEETETVKSTKNSEGLSVELRASDIRTEEDLIKFGKIDTDRWEAIELMNEFWGNDDNPHYLIKGKYKPRTGGVFTPKEYAEKFKDFVKSVELPTNEIEKYSTTGFLYELDLFDLHFGQQSLLAETGDMEYNPDVAAKMYMDSINYFIQKTHDTVEKYVIPVGNDFFNVDSHLNTTTRGTPQQESSSFRGTFLKAEELLIKAINKLSKIAEVEVIIVPGNHDEYRMFYMGEFLKAFFRNTVGVEIDNSLEPRKYFLWGKTLLGFTHGNKEKRGFLPLLMAQEKTKEFAKANYHEWHLGHWHSTHDRNFRLSKESQGIMERVLGSLVPLDDFHKDKGYRHIKQSTCFKYHKEHGPIGMEFYHPGM